MSLIAFDDFHTRAEHYLRCALEGDEVLVAMSRRASPSDIVVIRPWSLMPDGEEFDEVIDESSADGSEPHFREEESRRRRRSLSG